jgi:hypothetical protein
VQKRSGLRRNLRRIDRDVAIHATQIVRQTTHQFGAIDIFQVGNSALPFVIMKEPSKPHADRLSLRPLKDWEALASWLAEASLSSTSLPKAHDLSSSATAPILRRATLGGESERVFFAFFTLVYRKRTEHYASSS